MKKLFIMAVLVASSATFAADVNLGRVVNGSGTPGVQGVENASVVDNAKVQNDILHTPQYMPGFPTAGTIWPRVIDVPCVREANGDLKCDGYKWTPNLGRGEYLFVTPRVTEPVKPLIQKELVPVYIEVEKKKIRE